MYSPSTQTLSKKASQKPSQRSYHSRWLVKKKAIVTTITYEERLIEQTYIYNYLKILGECFVDDSMSLGEDIIV